MISRTTFILFRTLSVNNLLWFRTAFGPTFSREGPTVFSDEALSKILTEADRIVVDAHDLLDKALATGQDDLVEAARNNLYLVIKNRDRLDKVFSLRLATTIVEP